MYIFNIKQKRQKKNCKCFILQRISLFLIIDYLIVQNSFYVMILYLYLIINILC